MIVVDASAVGTFLIPDEASDFADFARDQCARNAIHVPAHWHVEMASLIRNAHRRGRLSDDQVIAAARVSDAIASSVTTAAPPSIGRIVQQSIEHGLSAYDACYLELARSLSLPLLTEDGALRRAATRCGVEFLSR